MGIIEGAAAVIIGLLLGRFLPGRRKGLKPVEAVCGCDHHYSMHDPGTGACNATVQVSHYGGSWGYEPCACVRYSGPEPIPSLYAPEIATEAGE
jgi:hypothetical protein